MNVPYGLTTNDERPAPGGMSMNGMNLPGFPDKFMPFMDMPPGAGLSSLVVKPYGTFIRRLRGITNRTANTEPRWRHNRELLTSGYNPRWRP